MIRVRTETIRQIAAILAVAIAWAARLTPSFAFTAEAQLQCSGDAFRFAQPCGARLVHVSIGLATASPGPINDARTTSSRLRTSVIRSAASFSRRSGCVSAPSNAASTTLRA